MAGGLRRRYFAVLDENKVSSFRRLETQKLRCDPARYDG
jgi:hypothetical protein